MEPHTVGSIMHVVKRGTQGMCIVPDVPDKKRFVRSLFYLNDTYQSTQWIRDTSRISPPQRPDMWPEQEPLVDLLAWTLLPNHFHLLVREVREAGIAQFMQRLCGSMTMQYNERYDGQGSIFQGSYRGRLVDSDEYFRWVVMYILVKNTLELYPGGLSKAIEKFDVAWEWGKKYPYSSLGVFERNENMFGIVDIAQIVKGQTLNNSGLRMSDLYGNEQECKKDALNMLETYMQRHDIEFNQLTLE